MEAQWVLVPLLQHLLFEGDHLPPFDAILRSLRSSLARDDLGHPRPAHRQALLPCGHRRRWRRRLRQVLVAAECDADVRRLAGNDHDMLTFVRLVPELDMSLLPGPLLAMQATRLAVAGGGVALKVSVHHAVANGPSL
ncbi:uncharacterized protein [Miscanthus floridulus]|uniref:uncharacterized protein n=1 Tax=Miscanthus floridulus TaxID=154761 RepID=UPI00345948A4